MTSDEDANGPAESHPDRRPINGKTFHAHDPPPAAASARPQHPQDP
jgi:hypothetical protein